MEKQEETAKIVHEWMIRPCELYNDEYNDCRSFKARFHQYFIYGETVDCTQWKKDLDNCYKWEKSKNEKARDAIILSEQTRRHARLKAHYENDTWKVREHPPEDWNKPLPEWMVKRDENTYLNIKSKQMRGEECDVIDPKKWSCSIM